MNFKIKMNKIKYCCPQGGEHPCVWGGTHVIAEQCSQRFRRGTSKVGGQRVVSKTWQSGFEKASPLSLEVGISCWTKGRHGEKGSPGRGNSPSKSSEEVPTASEGGGGTSPGGQTLASGCRLWGGGWERRKEDHSQDTGVGKSTFRYL